MYSYFVLIFERKLDVMSNERAMSVLGLGKKKVGTLGGKIAIMMITKMHIYWVMLMLVWSYCNRY